MRPRQHHELDGSGYFAWYFLVRKVFQSGLQRSHVDHEAVVDVGAVFQLLERVVDLIHSDHLAVGQDVLPRAEVEQLLGLRNAADRRSRQATASHDKGDRGRFGEQADLSFIDWIEGLNKSLLAAGYLPQLFRIASPFIGGPNHLVSNPERITPALLYGFEPEGNGCVS